MKQEIDPQHFISRLNSVREQAVTTGDIKPIATTLHVVEQSGIFFQIRVLDRARNKPSGFKDTTSRVNPFLPYEEALYAGHLPTGHVVLLNKYSIVENHFLIVSPEFIPQEELLSVREFEALCFAMQATPLLVFFNSGPDAGASQPHRHLQAMPLPEDLPVTAALHSGLTLPFRHQIIHYQQLPEPDRLYQQYLDMLHAGALLNQTDTHPLPHNLLITPEWMMVVPRQKRSHAHTAINALGFAGLILVKNRQRLAELLEDGPVCTLAET